MNSASSDSTGASRGSLKTYTVGFLLSVVLTVIPFYLVMSGGMSRNAMLWGIGGAGDRADPRTPALFPAPGHVIRGPLEPDGPAVHPSDHGHLRRGDRVDHVHLEWPYDVVMRATIKNYTPIAKLVGNRSRAFPPQAVFGPAFVPGKGGPNRPISLQLARPEARLRAFSR